jgi:hypothetical protein
LINEGYPSPSELIDNEISTLESLKNDSVLAAWKIGLVSDADNAYYRARTSSSFNFDSCICAHFLSPVSLFDSLILPCFRVVSRVN